MSDKDIPVMPSSRTILLVMGADRSDTRANIARIANDVARHIQLDPVNPAISADVIALKKVLPTMSVETLLAPLPISDEFRAAVMREVISGIPP